MVEKQTADTYIFISVFYLLHYEHRMKMNEHMLSDVITKTKTKNKHIKE
jgi:hypothetical protein